MEKLYLSPLVDIFKKNNKIFLCEDDIYTIEYEDETIFKVLDKLKKGCTEFDIKELLGEEGKNLIETLSDMGFIKVCNNNKFIDTPVEKQVEYLFSITKDGNEAQIKLGKATVCIIGVGGIGAIVIQHLVVAGIKNFVLVDGDKVNSTNFNRQLIYRNSQIGMKKVYAAMEYIQENCHLSKVLCIDKFLNSKNDLKILDEINMDFIVCGADKPYNKIQALVSEYSMIRQLPSMYANVGINVGNWGPLIDPLKDISYREYLDKILEHMNDDERAINKIERQPLTASFCVTNTIIGVFMSNEIIKYLIGIKENTGKIFAIDFKTYEISEENINEL